MITAIHWSSPTRCRNEAPFPVPSDGPTEPPVRGKIYQRGRGGVKPGSARTKEEQQRRRQNPPWRLVRLIAQCFEQCRGLFEAGQVGRGQAGELTRQLLHTSRLVPPACGANARCRHDVK